MLPLTYQLHTENTGHINYEILNNHGVLIAICTTEPNANFIVECCNQQDQQKLNAKDICYLKSIISKYEKET